MTMIILMIKKKILSSNEEKAFLFAIQTNSPGSGCHDVACPSVCRSSANHHLVTQGPSLWRRTTTIALVKTLYLVIFCVEIALSSVGKDDYHPHR